MAKVRMDSTILKRDFAMFGKMHQYITEYANKTLLEESSRAKEIEDKAKLIGPGYQELRMDFATMRRSDKDDFAQLIREFEESSIFEHLMYLAFREAEAKGPDSIENSELLNVIKKRHRDKVQRLKYTLRAIRDVIKGNVKEEYGDKYPDMDMEEVILEQMETLDPELYEKYNMNLRKIQELKEAQRMKKEKANDSKLEEKEVEKRDAPGKTPSTGASAPPQEDRKSTKPKRAERETQKKTGKIKGPPLEDAKRREEKWEKEILEDNLREKKKKEKKLNKQKQRDIINEGAAQTPLKNAAAETPSEKSPLQKAYEENPKKNLK
ncbi:hypothetical protein JTB14_007945 [Gonioctena quinquepunctata]|nr:hypothetical protein JTB14_007945 [Gonioctena quinquepunctata]